MAETFNPPERIRQTGKALRPQIAAGERAERNTMSKTALVVIIRQHGFRAWISNGRIFAEDIVYDRAGGKHIAAVELRPSVKAVKAFLGY